MENGFDEEAFKEEVLKQAQEYLNRTSTVGEVIDMKKEELDQIKADFKALWQAYNITAKTRRDEVWILERSKIRTYLYGILVKLLYFTSRSDAYEEVMNIHSNICGYLNELREERELLLQIKAAIKELEKYSAVDCNYDISMLLSLIVQKNALIFDVLNEDVNSLQIRLKGIDYISAKNKREELKDVNENIEYQVQELQLKPKY